MPKINDAILLVDHGTRAIELRPINIVQAAESDIRNYALNAESRADLAIKKAEGNPTDVIDAQRPYAFHPHHIKGRTAARDVIAAAIKDRARGSASHIPNRRRIYSDEALLRAAYVLAATSA